MPAFQKHYLRRAVKKILATAAAVIVYTKICALVSISRLQGNAGITDAAMEIFIPFPFSAYSTVIAVVYGHAGTIEQAADAAIVCSKIIYRALRVFASRTNRLFHLADRTKYLLHCMTVHSVVVACAFVMTQTTRKVGLTAFSKQFTFTNVVTTSQNILRCISWWTWKFLHEFMQTLTIFLQHDSWIAHVLVILYIALKTFLIN